MNLELIKKLIDQREQEKEQILLARNATNKFQELKKLQDSLEWTTHELYLLRCLRIEMEAGKIIYED